MYESKLPLPPDACNEARLNTAATPTITIINEVHPPISSDHDLRATCLTWMAIRGDSPLRIKARAGHSDLQTTEGYVRTAEEIQGEVGEVFAALPVGLLGECGPAFWSTSAYFVPKTSEKAGCAQQGSNRFHFVNGSPRARAVALSSRQRHCPAEVHR